MDHSPKTVSFSGRKPSKVQILAKVKPLAAAGETLIEVLWGENWLIFDKMANGQWYGQGWIKEISGDTMARELNQLDPVKFMRDHFQIINIS
jgi:hypothetical protein